ncbi:copper amine oxidase [Morchella snyderi]|nr:copper amine oxidase [Morchella snyderi]
MAPAASFPSLHPLTPLTPDEIRSCATALKAAYPPTADLQFKIITLSEPTKASLISWMERGGERPPRRGYISYYVRNTNKLFEAYILLEEEERGEGGLVAVLESNFRVKEGYHAHADGQEIVKVEEVVLQDEGVKAELAKLELPEGTVVISDPWTFGSDGVEDLRRQFQCFLYIQDPHSKNPDSNHYAFPLSICPVFDVQTSKVTRIDNLPTGADFTPTLPRPYKIPPPSEYTPECQPSLRTDLKPLQVVQPEGASFQILDEQLGGGVVEWQKWSFRIGFNHREGMVLYNVTYDGRSLFWRVSLSDMNIPYGDPRPPYHKKAAFDLGDVGAGVMANNLSLGCDCLGSIHYFSATLCDDAGNPQAMPNVICVHEQDAGIGFKHTNYRTGRAVIIRNRELVIQSIITVSNYEYILAFIFNQAGEMSYEVRATGILSTAPIDEGVEVPWGTVVHPGVLAAHHQHLFSLRLDPAIDGHENRLVYEEAHALPRDPKTNPHGVGYVTRETVVETSSGLDTDVDRNRVFKIQNAGVRNRVNGKAVGYKIAVPPFQKMLADGESWHYRRAEFADKAVYVTRYREGELWAAGKWTNQSRGGEGVRTWAGRGEGVVDEDLVVWVQFGINHIPRTEDFPVMPCETIKVSFKPVNFFERNPALDVPPSTQASNKSVLLKAGLKDAVAHKQSGAAAMVGKNGVLRNGCCD